MKWKEMTKAQKILSVLGWGCIPVWFVLVILGEMDIFEATYLKHMLFAVWCLSTGVTQNSKKTRILWCVLAAGYVILSMLNLFF